MNNPAVHPLIPVSCFYRQYFFHLPRVYDAIIWFDGCINLRCMYA